MFPAELSWINDAGATGLLALVVVMILFGWLVPRAQLRGLEKERDMWRELALKQTVVADSLKSAAHVTAESYRALSDVTTKELS